MYQWSVWNINNMGEVAELASRGGVWRRGQALWPACRLAIRKGGINYEYN